MAHTQVAHQMLNLHFANLLWRMEWSNMEFMSYIKRVLKPFYTYAFIVHIVNKGCIWFDQSDKAGPLV